MVSCKNIAIKSTTNDNIYLEGTITGLNSSKTYCMAFRVWAGTSNLPSKNFSYTYFGNTSSFNLGTNGCYLPKSDLGGKKTIDILCHEVSGNCETVVKSACMKSISVEDIDTPTPTFEYVTFYVSDDQPAAMSGVTITVAGTSVVTGSDGKAKVYVQLGKSYTANAYTPSEAYRSVFTSKTFTPTGSMTIPFKFERVIVPPPGNGDGNGDDTGNGDTCHTVTFYVKDQDGFSVDGAGIKTDGIYQCYTESDGKCTMQPEDTSSGGHKAVLSVLPDGYVKTSSNTKLFFHEPGNFITFTCKRKAILPPGNGDDNGNGVNKNIPPEMISGMPSGTTKILAIPLRALSWANISGLRGSLPSIFSSIASVITLNGYVGWKCLSVKVIQIQDERIFLTIFLKGA